MLIRLNGVERTVVAVAAFSGLRLSELRGLRWGDYSDESINVRRAVWRTHVGPTKTVEAEAAVPVLPILKRILEAHRGTVDSQPDNYIFAGRRGQPLNLANLARRVIIPAITGKVDWRGWHAFRRGLASNLYALSVPPKIIQAILRHADISTTLKYYVQTNEPASREALEKLENLFPWVV
jgi:integrase